MSRQQGTSLGWTLLIVLLTVAFVVLKLVGVIAWSWWWVLSPLWLPSAALLALALVFVLIGVVAKPKGGGRA